MGAITSGFRWRGQENLPEAGAGFAQSNGPTNESVRTRVIVKHRDGTGLICGHDYVRFDALSGQIRRHHKK